MLHEKAVEEPNDRPNLRVVRVSEQNQLSDPKQIGFRAAVFTDAVGRPRKLSAGAMQAVMNDFARGAKSRELAERYGVSTSLIRTICYHTRIEGSK
jgi:hypothetical protein